MTDDKCPHYRDDTLGYPSVPICLCRGNPHPWRDRRCSICYRFTNQNNKNIKGCGYIPNGKSPKKWYCPEFKPILAAPEKEKT